MVDIGSKTHQRNVASPTFLNMPLDVAKLVLEKLELKDLLKARKVCRSLRTAVDSVGTCFKDVRLWLYKNELDLTLDRIKISYTKAANGSSNVIHNEQQELIDGENFVERAVKDFKILSIHARNLMIWNSSFDKNNIVTSLIKVLNSEKCIHVKEIGFWSFSFDDVLAILPCSDAKELKIIDLSFIKSIDQFERITYLEQWKNAEQFKIYESKIASTMIAYFFHFKFFSIYELDEFSAQTVIKIRDDLLRRSTFQSCEIYFEKSKSNPIELANVFKPAYAGSNDFKIEFSNGNNKFAISLEYWESDSYYSKFNVKRL